MIKSILVIASLALFGQAFAQDLTLAEILGSTATALKNAEAANDTLVFEYTEKTVFAKIDDDGYAEKQDTVISRVTRFRGEELSREIIYSSSDDKGKKKQKQEASLDVASHLAIDDPDYIYGIYEITDSEYIIGVSPRKDKPDKGQVAGQYHFDKNTFLLTEMDVTIPRPEKLKEMSMVLHFGQLENGAYVLESINMTGRVKALLGIVNIRFKVASEMYDYTTRRAEE